ncbi:MAG: nodulation protein NfeD [Castellaniella sp.]
MSTSFRRWIFLLLALLPALAVLAGPPAPAGAPREARVLRIQDVIGPAMSDYVIKGLQRATDDAAHVLILEIDTPGGLDPSMRDIVQAILAARLPVIGFVSPGGARAASAGTFILYAGHLAAMTPASNLGAASPVALGVGGASDPDGKAPAAKTGDGEGRAEGGDIQGGDVMAGKVRNDAAAYLRSLAQLRGRDVEFADEAVRKASSLSAREALEQGVIDYIADDIPDLLRQLDGATVRLSDGREVGLQTAQARIVHDDPGWRTRVLSTLTNPQIAIVLMMIGVYGLFFELTSPGFGLPGVAGLISLLMGMVAFHMLPVNWGAVALLFVGTAMMIAEVFLPSFGALGLGGIVAFVLGGVMLTDTDIPGFDLSLPFLIGLAVASAVLLLIAGGVATRAHRRRIVTGTQAMLGLSGRVTHIEQGVPYALVRGEQWRVHSNDRLLPGDTVRVQHVDGLTLEVSRLSSPATPGKGV